MVGSDVLKSTEGKIIRVEGHTDNVAISDKLKSTFPTNWELSTARAANVVRYLQDSVGIEPVRPQAVGLSEYHPVATNETVQGRARTGASRSRCFRWPRAANKSRRVSIPH